MKDEMIFDLELENAPEPKAFAPKSRPTHAPKIQSITIHPALRSAPIDIPGSRDLNDIDLSERRFDLSISMK